MHISLKKQIHDKKISNIIKIHDIVLFFAIFGLPQKKRQYLKMKALQLLCKKENLSFPFFAVQEATALQGNTSSKETMPYQLYISNKCAKQVLGKYILEARLQKKNRAEKSLPIVLGNTKNLPLYGQTLLIACRHEEQAQELYKYITSLYNSSLLGGFYQNTCKTREFLKALLTATSNKVEIYKEFLTVLSSANYKLVQTIGTPNCKLLVLLNRLPVTPTVLKK